uniref:Ig-like domain-containing protein n=1 Tax=Pundamilia nyererei TaxID=303518 RepID=A0A3B4HCL8_9CICH
MLQPRISKEKQEHLPTSVETVLNHHCASEQQHLSLVCFRPPFHWLLFFFCLFVCFWENYHKNITIKSGQNITLPCRASNTSFIAVEWSRFDLKPEYVLLNRDGHFDPHSQHLSFMNRVDLQERKMKDGDVSLILKDMTTNDTGTYECRVFMEETHSWKSISIIYLRVVDPPVLCVILILTVISVTGTMVSFLSCRTVNKSCLLHVWSVWSLWYQ